MMWRTPGNSLWNPFGELSRMQRDLDRLFGEAGGRPRAGLGDFPAVNVWTNEEQALVTAEIPGIDPGSIEVTVKDNVLSLRGSRDPEETAEGEAYLRQERGVGSFVRSFTLPYRVDADNVAAEYRNGILYLTLPRSEADKPKKIAVKAANE